MSADNKSLRADKEATKQGERLAASEEKIKSLEARLGAAEASIEALTPATESTKQACYMLRLALNDLGARAEGAPSEDGSAFDFFEWTQDTVGSVVEVAGAYGDCYARVAMWFVLSLLHEHGCDHVKDFPRTMKKDWPENSMSISTALRAFRKGF